MAKRYTREKDEYPCRVLPEYCLESWAEYKTGYMGDCCNACPVMAMANRLAEYEDKYPLLED